MNENTSASMEKAIGEIKVGQNQKKAKRIYTKADGIFALLYILLGYAFIRFFFFYDWSGNFDFVFPLYTSAYILTVFAFAKANGKAIPRESLFWAAVMLCTALTFKIERFFRLLIRIAVAAYFTGVTGGLYGGGTSAYIAADLWNTFAAAPFVNFGAVFPALFSVFRKDRPKEKQKIHPAVWGMVMGVCALWVIVPLLISADSNFLSGTTDFIGHLLAGLDMDFFMTTAISAVLSVPVFCYLYSLSYSYICTTDRLFKKEAADTLRRKLRVFPAVTLKVFLYIVCGVYVLFIALQAEYLLGAFTGKLYSGMTYARYARTGFFELCKIAAINLTLLAVSNLLTVKSEENAIKTPMTVLCALSLLLAATALAKMAMYIAAYGLTVKRIISTVFLLWLAVVFVLRILKMFRNFNLVKTAVLTGAVMFCILFSFDIGMHSHNFNIRHGFEKTVQTEYAPRANSLYLPGFTSSAHIKDSAGSFSRVIEGPEELLVLIKSARDTAQVSVNDTPYADYYYSIMLCGEEGDSTLLYIYTEDGSCCIEQPYNAICTTDPHLADILASYGR